VSKFPRGTIRLPKQPGGTKTGMIKVPKRPKKPKVHHVRTPRHKR